jgi:hypothetical protein
LTRLILSYSSFKLLNCTEFWTFGFGFEAVEIDRIVGETGEFNLM